jgi:hypothetical protein
MLQRAATTYHSVFHPYFHPISLGERGVRVTDWFRGLLQQAREMNLPGVNASQWLAFNDARMSVRFEEVQWREETGELRFTIVSEAALPGATVLLPEYGGKQAAEAEEVGLEGGRWRALVMDLEAGSRDVVVRYR